MYWNSLDKDPFLVALPVQGTTGPAPSEICSNLFNLDLTAQELPSEMFKLIHYQARRVGKRAIGILLECFRVPVFIVRKIKNLTLGFSHTS